MNVQTNKQTHTHLRDVGDAPGEDVRGAVVAVLEAELVGLVPQPLDQDPRVGCAERNIPKQRKEERKRERDRVTYIYTYI